MINIKKYVPGDFEKLLSFCKEESKEDHPAATNMWSEDWELRSETLPNILLNNYRFFDNNGVFFLLQDDDTIIGCSGIYVSDFSKKVSLAGTRTWVNRKYRTLQYVKNYLLPEQKKWAIKNNIDIVALTFNSYNSGVRRLFTIGQATGTRSTMHLFSNNFNILDFMVTIQYVPQWVIYENLSEFRFDWDTIRAK